MEQGTCFCVTIPPPAGVPQQQANPRGGLGEFVLTDSILSELRRQSADDCLLCWFDAWDGEDWD